MLGGLSLTRGLVALAYADLANLPHQCLILQGYGL